MENTRSGHSDPENPRIGGYWYGASILEDPARERRLFGGVSRDLPSELLATQA